MSPRANLRVQAAPRATAPAWTKPRHQGGSQLRWYQLPERPGALVWISRIVTCLLPSSGAIVNIVDWDIWQDRDLYLYGSLMRAHGLPDDPAADIVLRVSGKKAHEFLASLCLLTMMFDWDAMFASAAAESPLVYVHHHHQFMLALPDGVEPPEESLLYYKCKPISFGQ
jgi:hypothetical protein